MQPVLLGSAHRFAIFRQPPCFTGRGAGEGRLRATSGPSQGQAGWLSLTRSRPSAIHDDIAPIGAVLSLRRAMAIRLRLFRARKETPPPVPAREPWR
jgi:hypothetical protein